VNVGRPKNVDWNGRTVHTGIWKHPVRGLRTVRRLNVDGDGQGDLNGHGGEQRAVLVYQRASYEFWSRELGRDDLAPGQFGENFTVDGLPDDEVCIGDRYRIGAAEFEVTQPRVTCFRVGLRLGVPELPSLLVAHHRPGFYLRVITEGEVQAGDQIVRTRRGRHELSVADIDALLYLPDRDPDRLRDAVDIPALSPGWQQSFATLLAGAGSDADSGAAAPAVGVEPGWSGFRPLRVTRIVAETPTVHSIHLRSTDGRALPPSRPGQFLTIRVPDAGDPAPVRSYSLSADPAADGYRISVKHEPHGRVSTYLHTALRERSMLEVAAARGEFVLADGDEPVLLISAGIGATPVLAMLHHLRSEHSPREVHWIHAARDADQHVFADEAHRLIESLADGHEHIFYSRTPGGRLTPAALAGLSLPAGARAYICGPETFMALLRTALVDLGLDPVRIHTELFGALPSINPGLVAASAALPHQPDGPAGSGALVTFARSGLSVRSSKRYASVLELAEACDVPTRWSCRTGVCHTCVTPVVSGAVAYSPAPLEPAADGQALICCARPATDLVLDL
jgi:ferredoxin-NADP reductase/MOSC domain-containing protein YiiM